MEEAVEKMMEEIGIPKDRIFCFTSADVKPEGLSARPASMERGMLK